MHQKQNDPKKKKNVPSTQSELSEVWQELLGGLPGEDEASTIPEEAAIPTLESDPWSELIQAQGVEVVDLQTVHLQMSDQELEQVLQVMQEEPDQATTPDAKDSQGPKSSNKNH